MTDLSNLDYLYWPELDTLDGLIASRAAAAKQLLSKNSSDGDIEHAIEAATLQPVEIAESEHWRVNAEGSFGCFVEISCRLDFSGSAELLLIAPTRDKQTEVCTDLNGTSLILSMQLPAWDYAIAQQEIAYEVYKIRKFVKRLHPEVERKNRLLAWHVRLSAASPNPATFRVAPRGSLRQLTGAAPG